MGSGQRRGRSRWRRLAPIVGAAVLAFGAGAVLGGRHVPASQQVAERFASAWQAGDFARMHALSDAGAHGRSLREFAAAYRDAAETATVRTMRFGEARDAGDSVVAIPAVVETEAFGTIRQELRVPVTEVGGEARVSWSPELAFPGLRSGERLQRRTDLPPRAALLARDGTPLARAPDGEPVADIASSIVGQLGAIPEGQAAELRALGVPDDAQVGISGLERMFEDRLRGRAGGVLLAGERLLGTRPPEPAKAVRTTISPEVQQAAVEALGGFLGGIVAMRPATGEVLAAAGIPLSGLQPPGSTFKIVTLVAGLETGVAKPSDTYPVETHTTLEGVTLENNNGEPCGGTLEQTFAHSCNSVFAPMGVEVGAERLVAAARRFGFDESPGIPGAAISTLPPADEIGDDLALGSTAIGQGKVQATALGMTVVAATIARGGRRPRPTFAHGERRGHVRATSPQIARQVGRMMREVVASGTGTAAALPDVAVAGKTGTAELEDAPRVAPGAGEVLPVTVDEEPNTDAWFVAYAPAKGRRQVAVGVMLVRAGSGGAVAAPAARKVLEAAL